MNILEIVSSMEEISGPSNAMFLVAKGLAERGHNVTCAYYIGKEGPLVRQLRGQGLEVINLCGRKKATGRFKRFQILLRLIKVIHSHKIDVIHAHHWDADCYALLAGMTKRVKKIITLHSRSYFEWVMKHKEKYQWLFFFLADYFVCVSKSLEKEFRQRCHQAAGKVAVVYNAPPLEFFRPLDTRARQDIRAEFGIGKDEFLIGSVGNFTPFKGILYLLQALTKIKQYDFKLLLVGADYGNQRPEYERFLEGKEIEKRVIFAGFRKDIPQILDALDLFVFPSTEEVDPIALSEAMAKGKPIVATAVGGIPEKIKDAQTGILVVSGDSDALAEKIMFCMKNRDQTAAMGKRGKQLIDESFSFDKMIRSYEELYLS